MKRILTVLITLCIHTHVYTQAEPDRYEKNEWKHEKIIKGAAIITLAALGVLVGVKIYQSLSKKVIVPKPKKKETPTASKHPALRWDKNANCLMIKDREMEYLEVSEESPVLIFSHPDKNGSYIEEIGHIYTYLTSLDRYYCGSLQEHASLRAKKGGNTLQRIILGYGNRDSAGLMPSKDFPTIEGYNPEEAIQKFEEACQKGEVVALYIFPALKKS